MSALKANDEVFVLRDGDSVTVRTPVTVIIPRHGRLYWSLVGSLDATDHDMQMRKNTTARGSPIVKVISPSWPYVHMSAHLYSSHVKEVRYWPSREAGAEKECGS